MMSCTLNGAAFSIYLNLKFGTHFTNLAQIVTMKSLSVILVSMLCCCSTTLIYAQKTVSDAVMKYDISIESINGEKQLSSALNGATLTIFLTKDKSRSEMVSAPGMETTVFDNKANKGFILKEYSGQKLMITTTAENWVQKNQINNQLRFETEAGDFNLAGYNCKKATATSVDGKMYTVYYDPAIVVVNKSYNNAFSQLVGLPIQYQLSSGNLIFKYTLKKLSTDMLTMTKFDAPKSGFRIMTYEENQQLKKGE